MLAICATISGVRRNTSIVSPQYTWALTSPGPCLLKSTSIGSASPRAFALGSRLLTNGIEESNPAAPLTAARDKLRNPRRFIAHLVRVQLRSIAILIQVNPRLGPFVI